jgi:hypothetical protein
MVTMAWWMRTILAIYIAGFLAVLIFHLALLQMVTPGLALLRAIVWPIFLLTGWPHGAPLPMD